MYKFYIWIIAIALLVAVTVTVKVQTNINIYTATVTDKSRAIEGDGYLIFTTLDNGQIKVFENDDSFLKGKFNSSDVYAQIEIGKTYIFKVYGYRIPLLSWYENITRFHEIR